LNTSDRRELLHALLDYWEREMTDNAMEVARQFDGSPHDRILFLMEIVMNRGLARYDLAILLWARRDSQAARVFSRVLRKRFEFTTWMYSEAGFSREEAKMRARTTVVYMMGESTLIPESLARRAENFKDLLGILTSLDQSSSERTRPMRARAS
jgi:hypothetical protein